MKITDIVVHPLTATYAKGSWTAHEYFGAAQLVLIEVRTDAGLVGYGEVVGGPQKLLCDLIEHFSRIDIPDLIRQSYESYQDDFAGVLQRPKQKMPTHNFRGIVRDIHVPANTNGKKFCAIVCDTDASKARRLARYSDR